MIKILHIKGINDAFISFVIAFFCLISFNAFSASDRIALIIGNSKYQNLGTLNNTINDAKAVEKSLKEMGYKTNLIADTNEIQLRKEIKKFAISSEKASLALFFYAGHGAQVLGENYILPTDLEIPQRESDIQLSGIKVDDIINSIKSKTTVIFLDACRDNPVLIKSLSKGRGSYARGLAPTINNPTLESSSGIFIAYSTDSGNIALDGVNSNNSPFTSSLLKFIKEPISIDDMFSKVTKDVKEKTASKQKPYKYASLNGIVCLAMNCSNEQKKSNNAASSLNQTAEDLESFRILSLLKSEPSKNGLETAEKYTEEKSKLPNNFVLFNWSSPPDKIYHFIKPSSIKVWPNARASVETKSIPDNENASSTYESGSVFDCNKNYIGFYSGKSLNDKGQTQFDSSYGEPQYADISRDFPKGSIMEAARSLACNPIHLIPQVTEEIYVNNENWTRIYTEQFSESDRIDYFYLNNSIRKNNNTLSVTIKTAFTKKNLNEIFVFNPLKKDKFKFNPSVSGAVNTSIHDCGSETYTIHDYFVYDEKNKIIAYANYQLNHNDPLVYKQTFNNILPIKNFVEFYCKNI
jgi:uncharacterized caspase-like protein